MSKLQIQCSSIALKKDEILSLIPQDVKQQLQTFDKDYESKLKPYTLCHEGDAKPSVFDSSGKHAIVMRWTRDTVKGFINKLKVGLQFFDGHNPTNEKQTNNVLGKLVAYGEKIINGVTSAIGIGYFPNSESVKSMDVISAEFDVLTEGLIDNGSFFSVLSNAIGEITGLALGSKSAGMKPAFPNAESLQVQAFEFIEQNNTEKTTLTKEEILSQLTIDDIKYLVRERELRITQVFDANSILKIDDSDEGKIKIKSNDDSLNKWLKDHMKDSAIIPKSKIDTFTELEKKYKGLETSYGEAKPHYIKSKAAEKFIEVAKSKNLEQNQDKYSFIENNVKKNLDKFQGDVSMLDKHIETEIDTYSNVFEEAVKLVNKQGFNPISPAGNPLSSAPPQADKYTL